MIDIKERMIVEVVEQIYRKYPELKERYGEQGVQKCREDNDHHFKHLETAFELKNDQFFVDYALWLNGILQNHGMTAEHLYINFELIQKVLDDELGTERKDAYENALNKAIIILKNK
ncbi:hypothetical protein [Bacillus sp. Marseille-Q3570]|uniref:hypothetical protein n=1 Tax=Bacillus sp. Marseille-Q3570 TaxID=2963522 RepID=UPI0021B7D824|nr:hypothetical protein [Bacillus sp. Marseille-Q3570]